MATASLNAKRPQPISQWMDREGKPTQAFRDWVSAIDAFLGEAGNVNAINDAAAASAGVQVGHIYRNGSVLMIRVT